ncbi:MAG TPA: PAS domain S-box protein [Bryobacteraceae bacterium]|nr:PAS domain S-box protein [Bryobacteraceae bacterium]
MANETKTFEILLAGGSAEDADLVRQALEAHHVLCRLRIVRHAAKAIDLLKKLGKDPSTVCFDLLLLNMHLPNGDGETILKRLRSTEACAQTPIIFMNSSSSQAEAGEKAAVVYWRKPSSADEYMRLGSIVQNMLRDAGGPPAFQRSTSKALSPELLLAAIVDSSEDAIISKDLNGVITSWNKSAQRLFGYTAEEAIGQTVEALLIPVGRKAEEPDILARLRRGERVEHFETVRRRKDGTLIDISLTISPVRDAGGNIVGASKIARDITEAKRFRDALAESEARFRQVADSMPQLVWTARPDGFVDYYNERWYDLTGFSRTEFGDPGWQAIIHRDDLEKTIQTYRASIESGQPYSAEYRLWDRHEKCWRWFMGRAVPVRDGHGAIFKWFGSCTDIDEQKLVQEELQRANLDLEQFAFSASHDLQEPVRNVKIYSELLDRELGGHLSSDARMFLKHLRTGATRMQDLMRGLLSYTRAENFKTPAEGADANEALRTVLTDLSSAAAEAGARITAEPLPSVHVRELHLQQLFQNLINNAIKYRCQERAPEIHVSAEQHNGYYVFAVRDNGIGIEPEYRESIFGLFKRLHTRNEYSGAGIGLAICRRIVERYHGRIWVESEPANGSTFHFTIPV